MSNIYFTKSFISAVESFISDYHAASGLSLTFIDVVHKIFAENQSYDGYSYSYFSVSENQVFSQPFVYQIKYKSGITIFDY